MLDALAEHFPREAEWTQPAGRAVHLGDAARLHRHDRPARARAASENVAFVPGRAAYVDGRGGSSMRLNFSGVDEDEIREGVRRIGKVVARAGRAYGTLDRRAAPPAAPAAPRAGRADGGRAARGRAARCRARRQARRATRRSRSMSTRRGPEGRPLAGAAGVAALGRAGARTRSSGSGTRWSRSTSAPTSSSGCASRARRGVRRAARPRRRGRHRPGAARGARASPYTGSGVGGLHPLLPTRCWPST